MNNITLFLIDDDEDNRELFQIVLNMIDSSIKLVYANDGMQALELVTDPAFSVPDIIFLDLHMPRMNGLEFLSATRHLKFLSAPIIIFSTLIKDYDINRFIELGARECVEKPGTLESLKRVVLRVLQAHLKKP
ncbi:MAG TPA: response regulator [Chitinophaga sp.]|uniref:response regulator n=1 Tax=Chitinophaga sp. TaxID=1869181 RepID=UPI002DB5D3E8|nr:response regulator [Chitinophaga sp.]HEU4551268.1 response regulator [Chitinophaga sp.]